MQAGLLLVVDVGNTNVSLGVFKGADLLHHVRAESARARTADEYAVSFDQMLRLRGVDPAQLRHAIIASVVPTLTDTITAALERGFKLKPRVVGPGIRTGMPILYENPKEVGADRIVNAVAAYAWLQASPSHSEQHAGQHAAQHAEKTMGVVVVDFGTATTFDCVTPKGEYLGGVIAPGLQISADALFTRAARLHRVDILRPKNVVGRNAVQSMQSGLVFGYAGLVDGVCARLKTELSFPLRILATGGLAPLIAGETSAIEHVDANLTLEGLRLIHELNESIAPSERPQP